MAIKGADKNTFLLIAPFICGSDDELCSRQKVRGFTAKIAHAEKKAEPRRFVGLSRLDASIDSDGLGHQFDSDPCGQAVLRFEEQIVLRNKRRSFGPIMVIIFDLIEERHLPSARDKFIDCETCRHLFHNRRTGSAVIKEFDQAFVGRDFFISIFC